MWPLCGLGFHPQVGSPKGNSLIPFKSITTSSLISECLSWTMRTQTSTADVFPHLPGIVVPTSTGENLRHSHQNSFLLWPSPGVPLAPAYFYSEVGPTEFSRANGCREGTSAASCFHLQFSKNSTGSGNGQQRCSGARKPARFHLEEA